jgi:hypothetical protein
MVPLQQSSAVVVIPLGPIVAASAKIPRTATNLRMVAVVMLMLLRKRMQSRAPVEAFRRLGSESQAKT